MTFKHLVVFFFVWLKSSVCANAAVVEQPSWWKHLDQKAPHHSFQKTRGGTLGGKWGNKSTMLMWYVLNINGA